MGFELIRNDLWRQFGASIEMLENAISFCPNSFWEADDEFWYISYHTVFWLDYYLTLEPLRFSPPKPYTLSEFNPSGEKPPRKYRKEELLEYLNLSKQKCHQLILNLTLEKANARWVNEYKNYSVFEILAYNMRHVQHHTAQLNYILRQKINDAPKWVSVAKTI